jgi:hypothetical protein
MKTFLQAEWRKLAMANYEVDPKILAPYLPYKTEFLHAVRSSDLTEQ